MIGNAKILRKKIAEGKLCLCSNVTFNDSTISELFASVLDFLWIDMEHNPLSLADIQAHAMAGRAEGCASIVRVPGVDWMTIKRVLDGGGVDGIMGPNIHNAEEARELVRACKYPPEGTRGFGPRRTCNFGRYNPPEYVKEANADMIVIAQLESKESMEKIDEILAVPGLTSICFGPMDMSGTYDCIGDPGSSPELQSAIEACVEKANKAGIWVGHGMGLDAKKTAEWIKKGCNWMQVGADWIILTEALDKLRSEIEGELKK